MTHTFEDIEALAFVLSGMDCNTWSAEDEATRLHYRRQAEIHLTAFEECDRHEARNDPRQISLPMDAGQ